MSGGYVIVARFEAKPGCEEELRQLLLETQVYALAEEPGCRRFDIMQGTDPEGNLLPNIYMTNELFDDYEAVEAHRNSWRTPIRVEKIRTLIAERGRVELAIVLDPVT